jgi:hypothetical protein
MKRSLQLACCLLSNGQAGRGRWGGLPGLPLQRRKPDYALYRTALLDPASVELDCSVEVDLALCQRWQRALYSEA